MACWDKAGDTVQNELHLISDAICHRIRVSVLKSWWSEAAVADGDGRAGKGQGCALSSDKGSWELPVGAPVLVSALPSGGLGWSRPPEFLLFQPWAC